MSVPSQNGVLGPNHCHDPSLPCDNVKMPPLPSGTGKYACHRAHYAAVWLHKVCLGRHIFLNPLGRDGFVYQYDAVRVGVRGRRFELPEPESVGIAEGLKRVGVAVGVDAEREVFDEIAARQTVKRKNALNDTSGWGRALRRGIGHLGVWKTDDWQYLTVCQKKRSLLVL